MVVFSSGDKAPPEDPPAPSGLEPGSSSAPLAIEAPPAAGESATKLDVSTGAPVSLFDKLGPMIVAKDGTLSRIGNWQEMDELERARVLRVLGKRNEIRLTGLRAKAEACQPEAAVE